MNRRAFIGRLTACLFTFNVLPPATTYGRIWRAVHPVVDPAVSNRFLLCSFTQFLVDQSPLFDETIIEAIRPSDDWLLSSSKYG